jgi:hypothetical protein
MSSNTLVSKEKTFFQKDVVFALLVLSVSFLLIMFSNLARWNQPVEANELLKASESDPCVSKLIKIQISEQRFAVTHENLSEMFASCRSEKMAEITRQKNKSALKSQIESFKKIDEK